MTLGRGIALRNHLIGSVALLAISSQSVLAQSSVPVQVKAQSLEQALKDVARQTHTNILFTPNTVRAYRAPEVSGAMDVAQAVRLLLRGTPLESISDGRGGLVVRNKAVTAMPLQGEPVSTAAPFAADQATREADAPTASLQDIIVTGSRLATSVKNSPTPITQVSVAELVATHPTTVFEGLKGLPQFAGSTGVTSDPQAAGQTNSNVSALSLRGLGAQRTLILYDGHRMPPTQSDGAVDINLIPQMLLKRVDVVTGGVSAVYGSGGVTGVVNFVTDRKFNGLKLQAQGGISQYGDDPSHELGIAGGMALFDGRGHIEGSYQHHYDGGIMNRSSRAITAGRYTLQGSGTTASPYAIVAGATMQDTTFGGRIMRFGNSPLAGMQFLAGGVLAPFNSGAATSSGGVQIGGDGGYYNSSSLKTKLNFHQIYERFDFDFNDRLHFYLTGAGTIEDSYAIGSNNKLSYVNLSATNAFLAPAYQTALLNAGQSTFTFNKLWDPSVVPPTTAADYTSQWFVNTGLEGAFSKFKWETSFTAGHAFSRNVQNNDVNYGRLYAALDAVKDPSSGKIVCQVSLTANAGLYPGCVPLNVFGPGSESPAAVNYIMQQSVFRTSTNLVDASAQINGPLFEGWAGPVTASLAGDLRRQTYSLVSTSLPGTVAPLNCTGLQYNCNPGQTQQAGTAVSNRPPVSETVGEIALEGNIPLVNDARFIRNLSLNLAFRHARYSDNGSLTATDPYVRHTYGAQTWKIGAIWKVSDQLTVRAARSRDFRAPTLIDLYAPATTDHIPFFDMLTNTGTPALTQTGGNPTLQPEFGYTTTAGFIFQPTPKFSLSVDAYDIVIKNAIVPLFGSDPRVQQACNASAGTSSLCALIERPLAYSNTTPANAATKWYLNLPVNIAQQHTWGADVEANFRTKLGQNPLALRALVSWQPHLYQSIPGLAVEESAGFAFGSQNAGGPVWRASVFASYDLGKSVTVDWMTRFRSGLKFVASASETSVSKLPSASYSNLTVTYHILPTADAYVNVLNLFNKLPQPAASAGQGSFPGFSGGYYTGDDIVGRYFNAGVRMKF
ncbi:hypothetical protein EOE18_17425 [Novosphingobium umbonatum]|uniref:Secretin/TonB short N-terminal domain-containing protein n=1 Tax=Novosphingobium umbonatum TaxID=1908524 RepID=A0A3S3TJ67_9SPHN|nr:TonB-dependent receptor [Novosphingobium umbonatum]RVU02294.1 hypothetical protein EOE18_17425 [Novosphingobium umbonatum]